MIYPLFYFQRGKQSDINWILEKMSHIPESKKQDVANEYEKIYFQQGRKAANVYLHGVSKEYFLLAEQDRKKATLQNAPKLRETTNKQ